MKMMMVEGMKVPTVLTALCQYGATSFLVEDDRSGSGTWLITLEERPENLSVEALVIETFQLPWRQI